MPVFTSVPDTSTFLGDMLEQILAVAASSLGTLAPERRFVSPGAPVPDCAQLTVHANQLRSSQTPTISQILPRGTHETVTICDIVVTYYLCVSKTSDAGKIPSVADLDEDGRTLARVGQLLWFGLVQASFDGTLLPAQAHPSFLWRSAAQLDPAAGLAGWRVTAEVAIE